jgi:hypothetical protein
MEGFCKSWEPCGVSGGGCCRKNMYGGQPSIGICMQCPERDPGKVELTVRQTEKPVGGLLSKAVSYIKAEASALISSITDDKVERRLEACSQCPDLLRSANPKEFGWCKSCGCGKGARAELSVKAKMPAATCPRNKWP